jgi:hypothetical protein
MRISDIIYYGSDERAAPDPLQMVRNAFTPSGQVKRPLSWPPAAEEPLTTPSATAFLGHPAPETSEPHASYDLAADALTGERTLPDESTRAPMRAPK